MKSTCFNQISHNRIQEGRLAMCCYIVTEKYKAVSACVENLQDTFAALSEGYQRRPCEL